MEYISIELKANSEGLFLDVFAHTEDEWWPLVQFARTWSEMNITRPEEIDDNTGTLWSETFEASEVPEVADAE